ncbi:MAG: aromatic amino acid lyase, partial [Actinomycetota bacterium]
LGVAELANISERRIEQLVNPHLSSGLPPFLAPDSGLNSGFMIAQVSAAALVSENKILAHPASVDSIPSSAGQEDHVSMGMTSARHARDVVEAAELVVGIEVLAAAQALDLRAPLDAAAGTRVARDAVRSIVPFLDRDRELAPDIEGVVRIVRDGSLVDAVEREIGELR